MKNVNRLSALLALALLAAACSPQATATQAYAIGAPATEAPAQPAPAVQVGQNDALGSLLVDSSGMTLYIFLKDGPNTSQCYDACAQNWPPLLVQGSPVAGDGVNDSLLGAARRSDGATQVTYNGWPLYHFAADQQPGDANGQGVQDIWYVISPAGERVKTPSAPATDGYDYGRGAATEAPASITPSVSASDQAIAIANFSFGPKELEIKVGTTVTWTNQDGASHTVSADNGVFDSGSLSHNETFSYTFSEVGTFTYHCGIHPSMTATVTVVP